jgi:hypothetical protein
MGVYYGFGWLAGLHAAHWIGGFYVDLVWRIEFKGTYI